MSGRVTGLDLDLLGGTLTAIITGLGSLPCHA